jgi:hypothetical protein
MNYIVYLIYKIFVYYLLLLVFANIYWLITLIYAISTTRSKAIKVKNIVRTVDNFNIIIDSNDEPYKVFKDSFLTEFNILNYINKIEINKEYEIKFYGFNTYFTNKKIFYIKLDE